MKKINKTPTEHRYITELFHRTLHILYTHYTKVKDLHMYVCVLNVSFLKVLFDYLTPLTPLRHVND